MTTIDKKGSVIQDTSVNSTLLWGSSSGDLESLEEPFIAITPRFTLTGNGSSCNLLVKYICLKIIHIWEDRLQKKINK